MEAAEADLGSVEEAMGVAQVAGVVEVTRVRAAVVRVQEEGSRAAAVGARVQAEGVGTAATATRGSGASSAREGAEGEGGSNLRTRILVHLRTPSCS